MTGATANGVSQTNRRCFYSVASLGTAKWTIHTPFLSSTTARTLLPPWTERDRYLEARSGFHKRCRSAPRNRGEDILRRSKKNVAFVINLPYRFRWVGVSRGHPIVRELPAAPPGGSLR